MAVRRTYSHFCTGKAIFFDVLCLAATVIAAFCQGVALPYQRVPPSRTINYSGSHTKYPAFRGVVNKATEAYNLGSKWSEFFTGTTENIGNFIVYLPFATTQVPPLVLALHRNFGWTIHSSMDPHRSDLAQLVKRRRQGSRPDVVMVVGEASDLAILSAKVLDVQVWLYVHDLDGAHGWHLALQQRLANQAVQFATRIVVPVPYDLPLPSVAVHPSAWIFLEPSTQYSRQPQGDARPPGSGSDPTLTDQALHFAASSSSFDERSCANEPIARCTSTFSGSALESQPEDYTKFSICVNQGSPTEFGWWQRAADIPATGCLMLVDRSAVREARSLGYDDGVHYFSFDDLTEKLTQLSKWDMSTAVAVVRKQGQSLAFARHLLEHRASTLHNMAVHALPLVQAYPPVAALDCLNWDQMIVYLDTMSSKGGREDLCPAAVA